MLRLTSVVRVDLNTVTRDLNTVRRELTLFLHFDDFLAFNVSVCKEKFSYF